MEQSIKKLDEESYSVPERPKMRWIEAFPVEMDDGKAYGIRDPQKIAPHPLVLPTGTFVIASLMDGTRTLFEIQQAFEKQFQQKVPLQMLESVVRQLDEELYLESDHFDLIYHEIQSEFLNAPIRLATHAGGAYDGDREALQQNLNKVMQDIESSENGELVKHVSLLISPHIDLHRGGPGFAHAYNSLIQTRPADLYVILGTGHNSFHQYMTCTKKAFETPLGITKTDENFVDEFAERVPFDVFEEEFIHRDEHSIEFQVLFLQHVLGDSWNGKMVPILCGSFQEFIADGSSPKGDEVLAQALNVLREMIQNYNGIVTVIAGVDMSHVGKRFGHAEGAPEQVLERVRKEDHDVLDALVTGDPELFFRSIEKNKDCNHVCGLTPIYMCLDIVQPENGKVLFYDQAVEGDHESVVSFASAVFYDEN